jgi:hypothetical protein
MHKCFKYWTGAADGKNKMIVVTLITEISLMHLKSSVDPQFNTNILESFE